ncbi:hypothetical protein [Spirulina sp. 06S082]|uniref:hypothetical protein n=1 Tax=Spirulina sp. 06S082 TaxID=3110248 RepID=UPI002B1EF5FB|nr:hypothetical protein [Spirulina sp. 06S082]MEA5472158.1 hypothetical protein [Spirulina sp. 06S082]
MSQANVPTSAEIVQLVSTQMSVAVGWGVSAGTGLFALFAVISILRFALGVSGNGHQATPSSQAGSVNPYTSGSTPYTNLSERMGVGGPSAPSTTPLSSRLKS